MTLAIVVQRGAGDKNGQDVVNPLIASTPVALSKGRAVLDQEGSNLQTVRVTTTFRPDVKLGQLVEVHDSLQGESWKGKLVGIRHVVRSVTLITELTVTRPT